MSILIGRDTRVITQGITGKTGAFHTRLCREYANGKNCFVAGVNPGKAGESFEGIPIFGTVNIGRRNNHDSRAIDDRGRHQHHACALRHDSLHGSSLLVQLNGGSAFK